jgi:hypothetical protein
MYRIQHILEVLLHAAELQQHFCHGRRVVCRKVWQWSDRLRGESRDFPHHFLNRGMQEGIPLARRVVCYEELLVNAFRHVRLLEEAVQLALHREEACLVGALHVRISGLNCSQVGGYLFPGMHGATLTFLDLLHKSFDVAIHVGE